MLYLVRKGTRSVAADLTQDHSARPKLPSDNHDAGDKLVIQLLPDDPEWACEAHLVQNVLVLKLRGTVEQFAFELQVTADGDQLQLAVIDRPDALNIPQFFQRCSRSTALTTAEQRLRELLPDEGWQRTALTILEEANVIEWEEFPEHAGGWSAYDTDEEMVADLRLTERLVDRMEDPRWRLWLAAGDWLLAVQLAEEAGDQELIDVVSQRAEQCVNRWLSPAHTEDGSWSRFVVQAIHQRGHTYLRDHLRPHLRDPEWAKAWVRTLMMLEDQAFAPEV